MVEIIDFDDIAMFFVNKLNKTLLAREMISAGIFMVLCLLMMRSFTNGLSLHGNVEMFLTTAKIYRLKQPKP